MVLTKNILSTYYKANQQDLIDGEVWYSKGHEICSMIANQYGLNVETVAGVVSALSPNNKWDRNIIDAENLIRAYLFEIEYPKVCTFGTQRDKAIMMLENNYDNPKNIARVLNGNKTIAFYKGLATGGKCDEITVDGHAYNIWNGYYTPLNKVPNISDKLYAHVSLAYKVATNTINKTSEKQYSPNNIQAITWVCHRRIHPVSYTHLTLPTITGV